MVSASYGLCYRSHDESWAFSKLQRTVFDRPPRHLAVIERYRVIGKFLVGLVALPGDENDVVRLGKGDSAGDGFCAVRDGFEIFGAKSFSYVRDNGEGIFLPRIIGGDDAVVGVLIGDASHQRPFLLVAIAACTEDENEAARSELTPRFEDGEKGVVGMSVIDENLELAFRRDGLEPPGNLRGFRQAEHRLSEGDA